MTENLSSEFALPKLSMATQPASYAGLQIMLDDELCFNADIEVAETAYSFSNIVRMATAWAILLQSQTDSESSGFTFVEVEGKLTEIDVSFDWTLVVAELLQQIEIRLRSVCCGRFYDATALGKTDSDITAHLFVRLGQYFADASTPMDKSCSLLFRCCAKQDSINIASTLAVSNLQNHFSARIQRQWRFILGMVSDPDHTETPLVDLKVISASDLQQVWSWNACVPESTQDCIHHIFMRRAQQHPKLQAVCAHDGDWTYSELDGLSTRLAHTLLQENLQPMQIVIIFIEKSKWVPVAQLAVMKAGCASVVLDATLPLERQKVISKLVGSRFVLTSPACAGSAAQLRTDPVIVNIHSEASREWLPCKSGLLPVVDPGQACYVVFTSGSTGTPKGVTITHQNYASAIATQSSQLGFREFDRVFDFTSYAFDVAWCNFMHTVANGGCLCIPSEEERKEDILTALHKYKPNYVAITPSAAWFSARELPSSVRTFHMGGEPVRSALVKELSSRAIVIHAYGPAECSTVSTANTTNVEDQSDPSVGQGLGCCTWVTKIDGSDLAPIGEIGELWIEGPIVAQGYLYDKERTSAAFIDDPEWLLRGSGPCPRGVSYGGRHGRHGRLYRTGDLVRYQPNGHIEFIGRKDSQVKIRGQRVELGEVEYHIQKALKTHDGHDKIQVIAEAVMIDKKVSPVLVAFLSVARDHSISSTSRIATLTNAKIWIPEVLERSVPPYMIPTAIIVIQDLPMTTTGKVDRRQLRNRGCDLYKQQVQSQTVLAENEEAGNEIENTCRNVWSKVLNLPSHVIGLDVHFTRLGGDSITAMQVVSRCREENVYVTVANILKLQTVRKIALAAQHHDLTQDRANVQTQKKYHDNEAWPLSPIQQMFFDDNPEGVNHYTLSFLVKLRKHIAPHDLLVALLAVTERHSMLRARFRKRLNLGSTWEQYTEVPGEASFGFASHQFSGLANLQCVVDLRQASLDLVRGPVFAVDIFDEPRKQPTLLMSAHHIIMDLVSWRVIWHDLSCVLSEQVPLSPIHPTFRQWCELQLAEAKRVDLDNVIPFKIPPPDYDYWSTDASELCNRKSAWHTSVVDEQTTSILLGASNKHLGTEIQDILVGTLVYCFGQIFPDRDLPAVFVETHGREPLFDAEDMHLGETVGWFTSMFPTAVQHLANSTSTNKDIIKFVKDIRARTPRKGRPYFACRYLNSAGKSTFAHHRHPEIIFNYRGSFQQLEGSESLFRLEDRPERSASIPAEGPDYRRPSLIDMNLVISDKRLHITTRSHKFMRNHESIVRWLNVYANTLKKISHELAALSTRAYSLADFPSLQISYHGLDNIIHNQLGSSHRENAAIKDMYPCTPMQEGILLSYSTNKASYHSVCVWRARATSSGERVSILKLMEAWDSVTSRHPATSTVFLPHPDTGRYVQVVLATANKAIECSPLHDQTASEYLTTMIAPEPDVSNPQCFFTICVSQNGDVACRLDMTHALMDASSVDVIAKDLEDAYSGRSSPLPTPFLDFVKYTELESPTEKALYWRRYLDGVQSCELIGDLARTSKETSLIHTKYNCIRITDEITARVLTISREMSITRSTFLQVAWSLLLFRLTGMKEVCFGYLSSGRDAAIKGIENIVGPLINMLVARVNLRQALADTLSTATSSHIHHLDHQHMSLADIQHEAKVQRLFNTCLTVGDNSASLNSVTGDLKLEKVVEQDPHEYPIVLAATLSKEDTYVEIQYRNDVFSEAYAETLRSTLSSAIQYLGAALQGCSNQRSILCDDFFLYVTHVNEVGVIDRWQSLMQNLDAGGTFPVLSFSPERINVESFKSQEIEDIDWRRDVPVSTQVIAAWTILQASYGAAKDVLIGWQAASDAIYKPLRVHMDIRQDVQHFLELVQSSIIATETLSSLSPDRVLGLGGDVALAYDFQTVWHIADSKEQVRSFTNAPRALKLSLAHDGSIATLAASFDSQILSHEQVERLFCQFEAVLRRICLKESSTQTISQIHTASGEDIQQICSWNGTVPDTIHDLVHNIFNSVATAMPDAPAISAWDGEMTYGELDQLSTRLAIKLSSIGVGPDVVVPLHFEKSMWEPVAVLGVMKAGGASVAIDVSQPIGRAQAIVRQLNAPIMIVSNMLFEKARKFQGPEPFVLDRHSCEVLPKFCTDSRLPCEVQPSHLVYVCFTSGTTGQPKGAMITHSNFTSAIKHQQKAMGFGAGRRVFDFASYSFDVAWSNVLHTLTSGSCLCIPSEHQRKNELADAIREAKATFLDVTPSVLRTLNPREFPDLETVMLGGEPFTESDVAEWFAHKEMINTYGPAECSIRATITSNIRGIGVGYGMRTWVVTTDGSERLSPIGAIGELWLEGPLVGRGYLSNEESTAKAFVMRCNWLYPEQLSRFYRTGDLVRYEEHGSLICVGRLDHQIKILGQRTELGEVEHNIQTSFMAIGLESQIMADVFKPLDLDHVILVAFFKTLDRKDARRRLTELEQLLPAKMPAYMIPTVFIGLETFPMTSNGKTDRKSIRARFSNITVAELVANDIRHGNSYRPPITANEKLLCKLWADTLGQDQSAISIDFNFFRIGGDSLGAMKLVSAARKKGVVFDVADVFQYPQLSSLALALRHQAKDQDDVVPFSLVNAHIPAADLKIQVSSLCGVMPEDVEDILPCTPLQEGMIAESIRGTGDNLLSETRSLLEGVEIGRVLQAWSEVVQKHAILRTRFVQHADNGLVQVIIRQGSHNVIGGLPDKGAILGKPLFGVQVSHTHVTWTIHHALYDGWSWPLIWRSLCEAYLGNAIQEPEPFQNFVKHVDAVDMLQAETFWKNQFHGAEAQIFPVLPSNGYAPSCDTRFESNIESIVWDGDFTAATKIRLAWAIVLSAATNSPDVFFGVTVSGRQAPVPGIENISGPTFATVPVRILLDPDVTIEKLLREVQLQATEMIPYEQVGLQQIQRFSEDCRFGCQFQSQIVVQPAGTMEDEAAPFVEVGARRTYESYPIAIGLELVLLPNGMRLNAKFDSALVSLPQFGRIAERFEIILRQICSPEAGKFPLRQIIKIGNADTTQIWKWNATPLKACDTTIHSIFSIVVRQQPQSPAICAWDGDFTYLQLHQLSSHLAHKLMDFRSSRQTLNIVPILFEKSKWTSVCQLAVLKAGCTAVVLDSALPHQRLQTILRSAEPQIVLVSTAQQAVAQRLASPDVTLIVVDDHLQVRSTDESACLHLPQVTPDTPAYIVFTSGSTGTPKGAIVSHSNFSSALHYGLDALGFSKATRSYDLASYAFDVSWVNLLYTLCAGGCLCVPDQEEMRLNPLEPIDHMSINTAQLTPTVAKLLRGANLSTINFGGETLPRDEVRYWTGKAKLMHSYGPSECTPCAVSRVLDPKDGLLTIGKGVGAHTWVVEPEHGNALVAIGDVGELWIEGPLVGLGYFDDPAKTDAAFIKDPEWLLHGAPGFEGRRGRLYRTGDLVRYQEDGDLEFVGRKDAQIKIRGQRVELEEIEHHVLRSVQSVAVQVVVDIVVPTDADDRLLVAFIKLKDSKPKFIDAAEESNYSDELAAIVKDDLLDKIPAYMIPNVCMVIKNIPQTSSGKTNRNSIRKMASNLPKARLLNTNRKQRRAPRTHREDTFSKLVAQVLSLDMSDFGMDDNFIQLGGDSISAMKLVAQAQLEGLNFTVADLLTKKHIGDLAHMQAKIPSGPEQPELRVEAPHTELKETLGSLALSHVQEGHGKLVEIMPTTHTQSEYLEDNIRSPRQSWFSSWIEFSRLEDERQVLQSVQKLYKYCDIYRTTFFQSEGQHYQAIFDDWVTKIDVVHDTNSAEEGANRVISSELSRPVDFSAPLAQFTLVIGPDRSGRLVFSMSHAIYDAISLQETIEILIHNFNGSDHVRHDWSHYMHYIHSSKEGSFAHWRDLLEGSSLTKVPVASSADGMPTVLTRCITMPNLPRGITHASLFTMACAEALHRVTNEPDIVFGRLVSGRIGVPTPLQNVVGPCINRVPVRIDFRNESDSTKRLAAVQRQYAESIAHETVGLTEIVRHCTSWPQDTRRFSCFAQYQNVNEYLEIDLPGVVQGLRSRDQFEAHVAADYLEFFAIPIDNNSRLTVRLIAGPGYDGHLLNELLQNIINVLSTTYGT